MITNPSTFKITLLNSLINMKSSSLEMVSEFLRLVFLNYSFKLLL